MDEDTEMKHESEGSSTEPETLTLINGQRPESSDTSVSGESSVKKEADTDSKPQVDNDQINFEEDPDLWGLRRSGRRHKAPARFEIEEEEKKRVKRSKGYADSSDSGDNDNDDETESDIGYTQSKRKTKRKSKGKSGSRSKTAKSNATSRSGSRRSSRKPSSVSSGSEDVSDSVSDEDSLDGSADEGYGRSKTQRSRAKNSRKKRKLKASDYKVSKTPEFRYSSRGSKVVNYAIEDDEDEFLESDIDEEQYAYDASGAGYAAEEDDAGYSIGAVLDHRLKEGVETMKDPKTDLEYYIKWDEFSHLHNTWETYESAMAYKGNKRLTNYIKNQVLLDLEIRNDPYTTTEDIESMDIERERRRDEYEEFQKVDRIVSSQRVSNTSGTGPRTTLDYLVKWKRLNYDECTWEDAEKIASIAPDKVAAFQKRMNSKILPQNSTNYGNNRPKFEKLSVQPNYVKGGELRDFQLTGLNWMAFLWSRNENGILADEMGLGKTVQTVAFLSWLVYARKQYGPFLVVVPLSTIPAWQETFEFWAPDLNYLCYLGNATSRQMIRDYEWFGPSGKKPKFNVLLTTYEYILKDRAELSQLKWQFLAVDEAHRLKNSESALYESLQALKIANRLLITGTPLQNNIQELAALIDFLMPGKFQIDQEINFETPDADQEGYIRDLHKRLQPFILRRLKKDVEKSLPSKTERILRVELSDMQTEYYKNIIARNYAALNAGPNGGSQISLLNVMMELKKASNHPYLFQNAEAQFLQRSGDSSRENIFKGLIMNSGKMVLMDKLLTKLKKDGHRVLIFSQMVKMLDILGDYLQIKGYNFQRLDGTIPSATRRIAIDHFNAPDSPDFVFLLSTRAGGLGINLMTADTVIIFDSDWNPQADLQAMARAHRIGQKSHVMVYRFVSKDTIEEEVLERARKKMILEYAIISLGITDKSGVSKNKSNDPTAGELSQILKFGAGNMFRAADNQKKLENLNIDDVLDHAEDHITTPDLGESHLGGEEFLRQFEVTDYKADVNWDDIIPPEELAKIKEEEKKRKDDEYLQEQLSMFSKRKAALKAAGEGDSNDDNESSEDDSSRKSRKSASKRSRSRKEPELDSSVLTEREIRGIYRAILRYGDLSEMWDTLFADGSLPNRNTALVKETYQELITLSQNLRVEEEAKRDAEIRDLEQQIKARDRAITLPSGTASPAATATPNTPTGGSDGRSGSAADSGNGQKEVDPLMVALRNARKRKERKAILFDFHGVKGLNAELIVQRPKDMKLIRDKLSRYPNVMDFRFPSTIKGVNGWSCTWTEFEDSMLLIGIYKHGYGAWVSIRDDPTLGLTDKFFLEEHRVVNKGERAKMPGAVHLSRRADFLISYIRDDQPSVPIVEKNRRRRVAIPVLPTVVVHQKSKSHSASPAPDATKDGSASNADHHSHHHHHHHHHQHGEKSKSKSKSRPKPAKEKETKQDDGYVSEYSSMDEAECKECLRPVRKSLQRLRQGEKDLDRKQWAKILRQELLTVGKYIDGQISGLSGEERSKRRKHLWTFASYFWPKQGTPSRQIMKMYYKLKEIEKKEPAKPAQS